MSQTKAHQKKSQPFYKKPVSLFLIITCFLGLCIATGVTSVILDSAKKSYDRDVKNQLESQAQNKVATITVWYGSLQSRMEQIASADMFRLFASEVNSLDKDITMLLRITQSAPEVNDENENLVQVASQLPLMRSLLQDFLNSSSISSISILNTNIQTYLSTEENPSHLTTEQHNAIQKTIETGEAQVLPVRATGSHLYMDVMQPIFAPHYVASPDSKPISVLFFTFTITSNLVSFSQNEMQNYDMRILQINNGMLQEIIPNTIEPIRPLPNWTLDKNEELDFAVRTIKEKNVPHYVLALKVPTLPWLVGNEISVIAADAEYKAFRNVVLAVSIISTTAFLLLLGMIWWYVMGRRERTIADELSQLYATVSQQKQLLDGINYALPEGILLTDKNWKVLYVNQGFASIVGRDVEKLVGLDGDAILGYDTAKRIGTYMEQVVTENKAITFEDILWLRSEKQHFQITCSPFKDDQNTTNGVVSLYRNITKNVEAQAHNQAMIQQTINALMRAIEAVDPYLLGQSSLTGELAGYLAQRMNLNQEDITTIRTAANLFQIGMIRLPHELINKTGQLTPEERTELQKHVEYTLSALEGIDFGLPIREAISQMYERMDGSGYPAHLSGEQIGIHGRILGIANTFCAMLRPRAYREAKTVEAALDILTTTPPQYDPALLDALKTFLSTSIGEKFIKSMCKE